MISRIISTTSKHVTAGSSLTPFTPSCSVIQKAVYLVDELLFVDCMGLIWPALHIYCCRCCWCWCYCFERTVSGGNDGDVIAGPVVGISTGVGAVLPSRTAHVRDCRPWCWHRCWCWRNFWRCLSLRMCVIVGPGGGIVICVGAALVLSLIKHVRNLNRTSARWRPPSTSCSGRTSSWASRRSPCPRRTSAGPRRWGESR